MVFRRINELENLGCILGFINSRRSLVWSTLAGYSEPDMQSGPTQRRGFGRSADGHPRLRSKTKCPWMREPRNP